MKEELKSLKDVSIKIIKEKDNFRKQKNFFNMKVEEQKNILDMEEVFNINNDSYESAKILNEEFPTIHEIACNLKEQHPKYGNKRLKALIIDEIVYIPFEYAELIDLVIDNYFLYESCGFYKLREKELAINELEEQTKGTADVIFDETKQAVVKAGSAIKNVIKPYGEVAKGQLNDASVATKKAINNGSKKLIKVLEKIQNKTDDNK